MPENTNANVRHESAAPEESLPFFARFLETQNNDDSILQAAPERRMTLKYPSDRDEWWDNQDK